MALARKCDRCGKFFEAKYGTCIDLKTSSDSSRNVTFDCGCNSDLDLCEDCVESFKRWWTDEFETTTKETSFKDYLAEQMEDPEFEKEYNKVIEKECDKTEKEYKKKIKELKKKILINAGFRNALRDAIYRKGDVPCNISKTLGLPANCLTNIIMGHTKKITYERLCWICNALNITEEDIING